MRKVCLSGLAGVLFLILVFAPYNTWGQTAQTIVSWDGSSVIATGGIPVNSAKTITSSQSITQSVTSCIKSFSASGWDAGSGTKYWQVDLNASSFTSLKLTNTTRSTGSGPKDFKVQYNTGSGWVDAGISYAITSANCIASINGVSLPAACDNQATLSLRWIMTSDEGSSSPLAAIGTSQITSISITGIPATPTTNSLSSSSTTAGGGDFSLTVHGADFISGLSTVTWNGSNRSTTFISATQLTAAIPASDIATAATIPVGVTTTGAVASSNTHNFSVVNPNPATKLVVSAINGGGTIIAGANFSVTVQVQDAFNNLSAVNASTDFSLSRATGSGTLGGVITGTIAAGATSTTLSNLTYSSAEPGVSIAANRTAGDNLTGSTSGLFTVYAAEPTAQATALVRTAATTTGMTLGWTGATGSPSGYVLLRTTTAGTGYPDTPPVDGTTYSAGQTLGNATIEYVGSSLSAGVFSTLTAASQYSFALYSYNGSGGSVNYYTSSPLQSQFFTLANEPATAASAITFSALASNGLTINFSGGNGTGRLVVVRALAAVDFVPADGTVYTANAVFSASTGLGPSSDNKIIYAGTGSSVSVTGLAASTIYYVAVYEFNGTNTTINYRPTAGAGSRTTLVAEPTAAPTAAAISNLATDGFTVSWTAATTAPDGYIVVQRSGNTPNSPVDGTSYVAGEGLSSSLVAYIGNNLSAALFSLMSNTSYSFRIFSYNGSGSAINYFTSSFGSVTGQTLALEPLAHASALSATTQSTTSISLSFSAANAIINAAGYLVLRKTGSAPTVVPSDGISYSVGNSLPGDATTVVAAIVSNAAATSFTFSALTGGTTYYFSLVPYGGDASAGTSANYYTSAIIPTTMSSTPSSATDVIAVSSSESATLSSLLNTATIAMSNDGAQVWSFTIRDGGSGGNDSDALPTLISALTFTQSSGNGMNDFANAIQSIALFDGTTLVSNAATITTTQIQFSGLNLSVPDDGNLTLALRLSLNANVNGGAGTGVNADGDDFGFQLSQGNITVGAVGVSSQLASFASQTSLNGGNIYSVIASKLAFVQGTPATVSSVTIITPAVTVEATDAGGNRDLQYVTATSLTGSGATLTGSPVSATPVSGLATFSTLQFSSTANGVTILAASGSLTGTASALFDVVGSAFVIAIQDFEGVPATPAWSLSANDGTVNSVPGKVLGTQSNQLGSGQTVTLVNTDITAYQDVKITGYLGAVGIDSGEDLYIQLSYDGGSSWETAVQIADGFSDFSGNITTLHSVARAPLGNPFSLDVLSTATQVMVRVYAGTISNINTEFYYIDNLQLTGSLRTSSDITNHFRTKTSGNWSSISTWQSSLDGMNWQDATLTPTSASNTVTVQSGHNLTVDAAVAADQVTISNDATLTLGAALTVDDGDGTDLQVDGTLSAGVYTVSGAGTVQVEGILQTGAATGLSGNMIAATTLGSSSTVEYNGSTAQTMDAATYANLIVNNAAGVSASGPVTITGILTLVSGSFDNSTQSITLGDGASVLRSGGALAAPPNCSGSIDVSYTGSGDVTTDVELPMSATAINNLTINRTSGKVLLAANVQVNGTLTLASGSVQLDGNDLTLAASVFVNGGSQQSHIITNGAGKLVRLSLNGSELFPVGVSETSYSPVTIGNTVNPTDWSVSVAEGIAPAATNSMKAVQRTWNITPANSNPGATNLTFAYNESDADILGDDYNAGASSVSLSHYSSTLAKWERVGVLSLGGVAGGIRTVTKNGQTDFSPFAISDAGTALPVTLTSFSGKREGSMNRLRWATSSESGNKGFGVERSADGRNFTKVGFVPSAVVGGNSNSVLSYNYSDAIAMTGGSFYYRLRQVDLDGRSKVSPIVQIRSGKISAITLQRLHPNPVRNGSAVLLVESPLRTSITLTLTDAAGRTVWTKTALAEAGANSLLLEMGALSAGTYYLNAYAADGAVTGALKIVK